MRIIILIIILAILFGILFLRLAVWPLIRRVRATEHKLIETNKQLEESQERYDLAVVGSQVGLWDWQVNTDNIVCSSLLKKMLGYTDEELPNSLKELNKLLHPDDQERASRVLRDHLKNHIPYKNELRLRNKQGKYLWFQVVGQALWNEKDRATRMAGSIMDITERKQGQQRQAALYLVTQLLSEALSLEEVVPKLLRAICEGMGWEYGAIWMVDSKANIIQSIGIWSRPDVPLENFKQLTSQIKYQLGIGLPGHVWQAGESLWISDLVDIDIKKFPRANEMKATGLHSGYAVPIIFGFKVLGVIEFFTIEKEALDKQILRMIEAVGPQVGQFIRRKMIENELRESETYKSAILESASDSIITIDDDGHIVLFNAQTERMFGYTANELRTKNITDLVPGLLDKIVQMEGSPPVEFKAIRENGITFPVELTISGMFLHNEHRYVGIIRDITERKKIEDIKNEFVAVVSHELRTPLTSIRGSLGLILGGAVGEFSNKAKQLLEIANKNCERLLLLINDILDIEKIEAGKMIFKYKPVDVNELVVNSIEANQMYADKYSVELELIETAPEVKVNVDPDRFIQVMTNLLSNATKFSPKGGTVSVSIHPHQDRVRISVADKGSGIPEEFKSRIFQKFSQVDSSSTREKGGTGLGLNISKMIVEKFDGTMNFVSELNVGTTFYFDIPQWHAKTIKPLENSELTKKSLGKLLICEDDEDQAKYLQALFSSSGYEADIAASAKETKELLGNHPYDALLLDLILPDQDGISLIRELRADQATQYLPIIVVSVIAQTGRTLLNGEALSVIDWLDKPVDFTKLMHVVKLIKKRSSKTTPKILHVEDDHNVQEFVGEILKSEAQVSFADSVNEAKTRLDIENFDLIILDLILPDGNGVDLLPLISTKHIPVVVFSSIELNRKYAQYVQEALMKDGNSQELVDVVREILHKIP